MREDSLAILEQRLSCYAERIAELEQRGAQSSQVDPFHKELSSLLERYRSVEERLADLRLEKAQSWQEHTADAGLLRVFDDIGQRIDRLFGGGGKPH